MGSKGEKPFYCLEEGVLFNDKMPINRLVAPDSATCRTRYPVLRESRNSAEVLMQLMLTMATTVQRFTHGARQRARSWCSLERLERVRAMDGNAASRVLHPLKILWRKRPDPELDDDALMRETQTLHFRVL